MDGILVVSFFVIFLLFFISFYLVYRESHLRQNFELQKKDLLHKYYEVTLLNSLMSRAGDSFDVSETPAHIITASERFFDMSVASFVFYRDGHLYLSSHLKEGVSDNYMRQVKEILVNSFEAATDYYSYSIAEHKIHNDFLSNIKRSSKTLPLSYFNVPLVYKDEVVGVISITSARKNAFSESDMMLFYQIVRRVIHAYEGVEEYVGRERKNLSSVISSLPGGALLFSVSKDVKLTYMNTAARQFLRIRDENTVAVLSSFSREDDIFAKLQEVVRDRKCIFLSEVKIFDKYFKVYINPVISDNSDPYTVAVTLQDMSLEKEIERVRDNFMHTVVHELRAPLTSIKGASDLLLHKDLDEGERVKMLDMIYSQTERMLTDVSDLLDAAKMDSGKLSIDMQDKKDINKIIEAHIGAFSYLSEEKQIDVSLQLGDVPEFVFDAARIGQVVNNLVSNAIKYSNSGGKLIVRSGVQDGRCIVSVQDDGVGIPEEKQPLLFSKFSQLHMNKSSGGSSGLGLYIAKGIVESHGGSIWVDSEEGKGTVVSFYLPFKNSTHVEERGEEKHMFSQQRILN